MNKTNVKKRKRCEKNPSERRDMIAVGGGKINLIKKCCREDGGMENNMKKIAYKDYLDKVYGCFIGKAISGNIGAPHEGVKMPMEFDFMPEMINCELPNDDLDLQVLWLDVVEQKGEFFTSYDLLDRFVNYCTYSPGEYAIMRKNYKRGIYPPYSGKFCNDYYLEGMGCPIRSEIWGCIGVGNMPLASELASRDGCLDHYGESIWAERFLAALEAEAFFESDVSTLIDRALALVPETTRFKGLIRYVKELCEKYSDIKVVMTKLLFRYGHPDCTSMFQNLGITVAALLLGENDIIKTSIMALNCGFDTDCTCATAGAIIGILRGADELIKAYGLTEITYTLGVKSDRRSNKIFDLAEDIAAVGVQFTSTVNSGVVIEGAPETHLEFEKPTDFLFKADYADMDPSVKLGESRRVTLTVTNRTESAETFGCKVSAVNGLICDVPEFKLYVPALSSTSIDVNISLPVDTEIIYDKNICTFEAVGENTEYFLEGDFGVACGAVWKVCGPFWRTEPVCTTKDLLENFTLEHPYSAIINRSSIEGNYHDKVRHFHLNYATDTASEYVGEKELFSPLDKNYASGVYEQSIAHLAEDSFSMEDLFGFKGPCVAYLSRIVIAEAERDIYMNIGYSSPFEMYLNGEMIAKRENFDTWTAENVHLEKVKLKKGENKLYVRMTRANRDTKMNVTFTYGPVCDEHNISLASKNPYMF